MFIEACVAQTVVRQPGRLGGGGGGRGEGERAGGGRELTSSSVGAR